MNPYQPADSIRVIALGVLIHRDHVLLAEGYDPVKQRGFYRAPGGGVDFGERAADTVRREFVEEFGREVRVGELIGVTENIFEYHGAPGHEIVFEFVARLTPESAPDNLEPLEGIEGDGRFVCHWLPLAEVLGGVHHVVPEGFEERLATWVNRL